MAAGRGLKVHAQQGAYAQSPPPEPGRGDFAAQRKDLVLRRAAEALNCTLVYALVPNAPLEDTVNRRARKIAIRDLQRVAHTMKLEAQETDDAGMEARIEAYIRDVIKERDLWKET